MSGNGASVNPLDALAGRVIELASSVERLERRLGDAQAMERAWIMEALRQSARADELRAERDEARADAMAAILDHGINGPAGRSA